MTKTKVKHHIDKLSDRSVDTLKHQLETNKIVPPIISESERNTAKQWLEDHPRTIEELNEDKDHGILDYDSLTQKEKDIIIDNRDLGDGKFFVSSFDPESYLRSFANAQHIDWWDKKLEQPQEQKQTNPKQQSWWKRSKLRRFLLEANLWINPLGFITAAIDRATDGKFNLEDVGLLTTVAGAIIFPVTTGLVVLAASGGIIVSAIQSFFVGTEYIEKERREGNWYQRNIKPLLWDTIKYSSRKLYGGILAWADIADEITKGKAHARDILTALAGYVLAGSATVAAFFASLPSKIKNLPQLIKELPGKVQEAFLKLPSLIKQLPSYLLNKVKQASAYSAEQLKKVGKFIQSVPTRVKDLFTSGISKIKGWFGGGDAIKLVEPPPLSNFELALQEAQKASSVQISIDDPYYKALEQQYAFDHEIPLLREQLRKGPLALKDPPAVDLASIDNIIVPDVPPLIEEFKVPQDDFIIKRPLDTYKGGKVVAITDAARINEIETIRQQRVSQVSKLTQPIQRSELTISDNMKNIHKQPLSQLEGPYKRQRKEIFRAPITKPITERVNRQTVNTQPQQNINSRANSITMVVEPEVDIVQQPQPDFQYDFELPLRPEVLNVDTMIEQYPLLTDRITGTASGRVASAIITADITKRLLSKRSKRPIEEIKVEPVIPDVVEDRPSMDLYAEPKFVSRRQDDDEVIANVDGVAITREQYVDMLVQQMENVQQLTEREIQQMIQQENMMSENYLQEGHGQVDNIIRMLNTDDMDFVYQNILSGKFNDPTLLKRREGQTQQEIDSLNVERLA